MEQNNLSRQSAPGPERKLFDKKAAKASEKS